MNNNRKQALQILAAAVIGFTAGHFMTDRYELFLSDKTNSQQEHQIMQIDKLTGRVWYGTAGWLVKKHILEE